MYFYKCGTNENTSLDNTSCGTITPLIYPEIKRGCPENPVISHEKCDPSWLWKNTLPLNMAIMFVDLPSYKMVIFHSYFLIYTLLLSITYNCIMGIDHGI